MFVKLPGQSAQRIDQTSPNVKKWEEKKKKEKLLFVQTSLSHIGIRLTKYSVSVLTLRLYFVTHLLIEKS